MRRQEIDHILTVMLESHDNVSDLNFTVEKPLQVESAGELKPVVIKPPIDRITPFQAEILALNLLNSDRRLTRMLLKEGSCDASYQLAGKARFRRSDFVMIIQESGAQALPIVSLISFLVGLILLLWARSSFARSVLRSTWPTWSA